MSKLLRVNMTDRTVKVEEVPAAYREMGGRWLTSTIVAQEVDPTSHPLGPGNKLVFAPGIVTGTSAPTSGTNTLAGTSTIASSPSICDLPIIDGWGKFNSHKWGLLGSY